jgi:signal transduction histidine kinase
VRPTFELLVAYLAFIRTAHYWTEMHPELTYEPDMAEMLGSHRELADLLLDTSAAEHAQGGGRLRDTLTHLRRVAVDLRGGSPRARGDRRRRVRRRAVDPGRAAGCGAVRRRRLVEGLDRRGRRTGQGSRGADLGRHRTARAEEQLRDANTRKDECLAMLAHELRNPLAPIRTGLELIRRGGDTVAAVERVRGMMERQVGHMVRLIDDLLDVSRINSGKIPLQCEATPLGSLVQSAVETNRAAMAAKQIALRIDLPEAPCIVDVDPTRFVQILSNLFHNATKFTNSAGSVAVSATITPPTAEAAREVSISVKDSGIGISRELLPRVFDLFTQEEAGSSQPGLGLGLALAKRLVELHGGRLEARSDGRGRGSISSSRSRWR